MEDERRMSTRTRKVAPRMAAALASADNRTQLLLGLKHLRMIMLELKLLKSMMMMVKLLLMTTTMKDICKRGIRRAQNVKPGKPKRLRMLGRPQDHSLSSCTRQILNPCLPMFHLIWGQLWGLQVKLLAVISAPFVVFLPTTPVSSVECASVAFVARIFMMTLVASNSLLEQSETSASDVNLYKVESKLEGSGRVSF